jgi:hypothetical protein
MKEVAHGIMQKYKPGNRVRLGFHKPPLYSIGHLHLHIVAEPIVGWYEEKFLHGSNMESLDNVIGNLRSQISSVSEKVKPKL